MGGGEERSSCYALRWPRCRSTAFGAGDLFGVGGECAAGLVVGGGLVAGGAVVKNVVDGFLVHVGGQLVAVGDRVVVLAVVGVGLAAQGGLHGDRAGQVVVGAELVGEAFEDFARFQLVGVLLVFAGVVVGDGDFRAGLGGEVRGEFGGPGIDGLLVVVGAGVLLVGVHLEIVGGLAELVRIGADHHAD